MYFETGYNEIITDVVLRNCTAISYYITTEDYKNSITLSAITTDPQLPTSISISYGFNGGRSLSVKELTVNGTDKIKDSDYITMHSMVEKVECIEPNEILLPKFDLSSVCINE